MMLLRSSKLVVGLVAAFFSLGLFTTSKVICSQSPQVNAPSEEIVIFSAADCSTPKTSWNLGEAVCAMVTGASEDQRIAWMAPDGTIAQVSGYLSGTARDSYQLPAGSDALAQVGTWRINLIDNDGVASAGTSFVVRDPHHAERGSVTHDVWGVSNRCWLRDVYRLEVTNNGPNDAAQVALTNAVPQSTTLVSQTQNSGPPFTCASPDAAGTINCTITVLPSGRTAVFTFVFKVDPKAPAETDISAEASVSSQTNELHEADNKASFSTHVLSSTPPCAITCPANITLNSDPNESGAIVSYKTPTMSGDCAVEAEGGESEVVCNPPSGTLFPMGTTVVTCSTIGGGSCSFTVTVRYNFKGFSPPVSGLPEVNIVEAGSAIPVKFSLSGDKGRDIFAEGFPASGVITASERQEIVTADNTSLSYDAQKRSIPISLEDRIFVGGNLSSLVIKLNDGSERRANFRFK